MKFFLLVALSVVVVVPLILYFSINILFSGADHAEFDLPLHEVPMRTQGESNAHAQMAAIVVADMEGTPKLGRNEQLKLMRDQMDARGEAFAAESEIRPVKIGNMNAEWVLAPHAKPDRRLLYIHGGAYMVGSAKSHRPVTDRLAKVTGFAVLAIDYRLLPEHARMDGLNDVRAAYQWILNNGPDGQARIDALVLAGDSSGGNMVLSSAAWARDADMRAADAVIAMSPQTDLTLSSPSLIKNIETDLMQGVSFGPVVKAPKVLKLLFSFMMHRINPSDPIVSPVLGDLSGLPPTLVQVSDAEMFYDDGARYVNKANAQGSFAQLQVWPGVMHVWQAFDVPEAEEAFAEMGKFVAERTAR